MTFKKEKRAKYDGKSFRVRPLYEKHKAFIKALKGLSKDEVMHVSDIDPLGDDFHVYSCQIDDETILIVTYSTTQGDD